MQNVPHFLEPADWGFQSALTSWYGASDKKCRNAEKHKQIKAVAAELAEQHRSAISWIPEDVEILYNDLDFWIPEPWESCGGRTTLAGNAVHSPPPHRGQGLNNALLDAWISCRRRRKSSLVR